MKYRWQDWLCVIVGAWLIMSPWWLDFGLINSAKGNACGIGAALAIFNLISAGRRVDEGQEILNIVMGLWLILSPFAFQFSSESKATTNVIAAGIVVIILAVWQILATIRNSELNSEHKTILSDRPG